MRELLEAGKEIARLEDENEELREKLRHLASGENEAKRAFTHGLVVQGIEAFKAVYAGPSPDELASTRAQLQLLAQQLEKERAMRRTSEEVMDEESTARTEAEVKLARVEAELVDAKATADMWRDKQHRTEELRRRAEAQVDELSAKVRAEHARAEKACALSDATNVLEEKKHQKLLAVEAELVELYEAKLTNTQRTQAVGDVLTKHFGYEVS